MENYKKLCSVVSNQIDQTFYLFIYSSIISFLTKINIIMIKIEQNFFLNFTNKNYN